MKPISRSRGVTLIELMISVVIGLLLAAASSYLFVSVQRSSKTLDARAQQQETAALVMDYIGRDLKNAGFFPAVYASETSDKYYGVYTNIVDITKPAFNQGIFGCSQATFNPATGLCGAAAAGAPDSLVINYFSADNFSVDGVGTRRDCLKQRVESATFNFIAYNLPRTTAANPTATVVMPLLVSNVYALSAPVTSTLENQTVTSRSFACTGNGNTATPQPLFSGVEELQLRYGVNDGTTVEAPARYYTAAGVNGLGNVTIDGEVKTPWQRVQAVQVCVVTKTIDSSARQISNQGSYVNCEGNTVTYTAADRAIYQRQVRVFGVRNNLTTTF